MKVGSRKKKRFSIILVIIMTITFSPTFSFSSFGDAPEESDVTPAIVLDSEYINVGNRVWFGGNASPLDTCWTVIDKDNDSDIATMLASRTLVKEVLYDRSDLYRWEGSKVQNWCIGFYNGDSFSDIERAIIQNVNIEQSKTGTVNATIHQAVNNEHFYLLSSVEAEALSPDIKIAEDEEFWWTRSLHAEVSPLTMNPIGVLQYLYGSTPVGVRPAFRMNTNTVLLMSDAVEGKPANTIGEYSFQPVGANQTGDWKLTLKDPSREAFTVSAVDAKSLANEDGYSNWSIAISWGGAKTGDNEYVSALLVKGDSADGVNGEVLYYGNIAHNSESAENQQITIPEGLEAGEYTLLIFSEQKNGDKLTDYASDFVSFPLKVTHNLTSVPAQAATCVSPGNTAYYSCACGKYFSDEEATNEIEKNSWIVPADPNAHDEEVIITPATLTRNGSVRKKCKICGEELDNTPIYAPTEIRLEQDSFDYTGNDIEPAVTVVNSNGETVGAENYSVTYSDNKDAGEATATVTFNGNNYTGTKTLQYEIAAKDIAEAEVEAIPAQVYTSKEILPKPKVVCNGADLFEGTDYTLSYTNNTSVGTAKIVIEGKGNYTGTKNLEYEITQASAARSFVLGGNTMNFKQNTFTSLRLPSLARPYQLTLTARFDKSMLIQWTDCKKLSADIDGYLIMRRVGSEKAYTQYVKVPADRNYYYDKSITKANQNYYYIVLAYKVDRSGNYIVSTDSMSVVGLRYDSAKINPHECPAKGVSAALRAKFGLPTINQRNITLKVGQTYDLKLTYPALSFSTWTRWRPDKSAVATVNSKGRVTARSEGTTLISGRTPNGRDIRCTVKVVAP